MNGSAKLDAWIKAIRKLPQELTEKAALDIADALKDTLTASIAAGQSPDGNAWPKTQDGKTPLRNAATALAVGAVGTTIIARVTGPEALHSTGTARGRIVRTILPTKDIPAPVVTAIQKVLGERFNDALGVR